MRQIKRKLICLLNNSVLRKHRSVPCGSRAPMILSPQWLFQLQQGSTESHQSHFSVHMYTHVSRNTVDLHVTSFRSSRGDSLHTARHVNKLLPLAEQKHHFSRLPMCIYSQTHRKVLSCIKRKSSMKEIPGALHQG